MTTIVRTEWRLQLRHGVVAAVGGVTVLWVVAILLVPGSWRAEVSRWALFFDLTGVGLFFVPALIALERGSGVSDAHRITPTSPASFLSVRVAGVASLATAGGTVVLLTAGVSQIGMRIAGVLGLAVLLSIIAVVAMGSNVSLPGYLTRVPFLAVPLLLPALLEGSGAVSSPLLGLSPVTSGMRLLGGSGGGFDGLYLAAWIAALALPAVRAWSSQPTAVARPEVDRAPARATRIRAGIAAWRSQATVDRRSLAGDRLLILVLAGVPLIAGAARWAAGAGVTWAEDRWNVDIEPLVPLIWAFVLVVHTPSMLGAVTGLLFLEDRDVGALPALHTTRWSLGGLVRWRLVVTAALTAAAVMAAVPLAGATHQAGWTGIVAAAVASGAASTTVALLIATFGRDRAQGMAVMKIIGLPFYAPLAAWAAPSAVSLAFLVVPSAWAVQAFWAGDAVTAWIWALGGVVTSALLDAMLVRRYQRIVVA